MDTQIKRLGLHRKISPVFAFVSIVLRILVILVVSLCLYRLPGDVDAVDRLFFSFLLATSGADLVLNIIFFRFRHITDGEYLKSAWRTALAIYITALICRAAELAYFSLFFRIPEADEMYVFLILSALGFLLALFMVIYYAVKKKYFFAQDRSIPFGSEYYSASDAPVQKPKSGARVFFKVLGRIFSVLCVLLAGLMAFILISQETDSKRYEPYTDEALCAYLDKAWQERQEHSEFTFSSGLSADYNQNSVANTMGNYLNKLNDSDLRFQFEVSTWNCEAGTEDGHITATADFTFSDSGLYSDLDRYTKKEDALLPLLEKLNNGETKLNFLVDSSWTMDDIDLVAKELLLNDVHTAAEWSTFLRYISPVENDGYRLASIEKVYDVDADYLQSCTAEMEARLDEMAGEIWAAAPAGESEMYLAAARAIIRSATYDDNTYISTMTDNLSDDEKVERSAYGAVITHKTVCSGYAFAFKALCDKLGLDCWVVEGFNSGGAHDWNRIKDGKYVDCTFCASSYSELFICMDDSDLDRYDYYLSVNQFYPSGMA